jgi:hypothetical protein
MRTKRWVTKEWDGSYTTQLMLWFGATGCQLQQFRPNEDGLSSSCATISLSTEDAVQLRDQLTAWLDTHPSKRP